MEIEKFNIGDWVMREGAMCRVNIADYVHHIEVEPIPLTEGIAKENGWKNDENKIYWRKKYDYISLLIRFGYPNNSAVVYVERGEWNIVALRYVMYVHELQHIVSALGLHDGLKKMNKTTKNM